MAQSRTRGFCVSNVNDFAVVLLDSSCSSLSLDKSVNYCSEHYPAVTAAEVVARDPAVSSATKTTTELMRLFTLSSHSQLKHRNHGCACKILASVIITYSHDAVSFRSHTTDCVHSSTLSYR